MLPSTETYVPPLTSSFGPRLFISQNYEKSSCSRCTYLNSTPSNLQVPRHCNIAWMFVASKLFYLINKNLIFLVPTGSEMEKAGKKLNLKVAAEIFADRNYEDDGNLVSRKKSNAMITDPEAAKKHVIKMVETQAINCYSGKQIPCDIDSICVHGDGKSAVTTAKEIKNGLVKSGVTLKSLDKLKKFA